MPSAAYTIARFAYSRLRRGKNLLLNLFDRPVVILVYHRVTTLASDPQLLAVAPENFRAQMRYLKDHHPVLRFEEDWSGRGEAAVVVTFDDGYADNVLEALPVLEEVGVPATFFVSTATLGTAAEFWWDELERVILGDRPLPESFHLDDPRHGRLWPTVTAEQRLALYRDLQPLFKGAACADRERWLAQLRLWAEAGAEGRGGYRAMTADELRRLAASPLVTVGAHTVTHSALSVLPERAQREEILGSKRELEALLEREVTVFSYPFGKRGDYRAETVGFCRARSAAR